MKRVLTKVDLVAILVLSTMLLWKRSSRVSLPFSPASSMNTSSVDGCLLLLLLLDSFGWCWMKETESSLLQQVASVVRMTSAGCTDQPHSLLSSATTTTRRQHGGKRSTGRQGSTRAITLLLICLSVTWISMICPLKKLLNCSKEEALSFLFWQKSNSDL